MAAPSDSSVPVAAPSDSSVPVAAPSDSSVPVTVPNDPAALDSPESSPDGSLPYPGPLRVARRPGLSPEQRQVEAELALLVQDAPRADALYNALPCTRRGRLLSMDHARLLSPHYATHAQRLANTPATRNAAAAYVKNRLRRALEEKRDPAAGSPSLLLGSGGPGSGKTTLISRLLDGEWEGRFANTTLVFDCTLSHLEVKERSVFFFCPF